jgi:hypothetical protein
LVTKEKSKIKNVSFFLCFLFVFVDKEWEGNQQAKRCVMGNTNYKTAAVQNKRLKKGRREREREK